jgi:NAD(P)H-dependent flavin oxidoreductase YrpB (nitropropane dioxygenase family)
MDTTFTRLVGCRLPIQLAVMGGGVGTPALAAAVGAAGGLGMLSSTYFAPLAEQLAVVEQPVGVGFFAFDLPNRAADLELAARETRVVDVFWGDPDAAVVERIHPGGALAFWQTGSLDEAKAAADAGCDAVIAQGIEAGGHVRGTTPLRELLAAVVPALDVPVIAAGGIATGAALRACLDAGAAAVRVATRLIATKESGAHADYVAAIIAAGGDDTVYTTAFGDDWPDAPHRVLRVALDRAQQQGGPFSALPPSTFMTADVSAMAMYAGMGVGDVSDAPDVATVLARMMEQCESP